MIRFRFARILLFHMYSGTFPDRNSDLFAVFCPSKKNIIQYLGTLGVGMTLFLLISYVYPNGQHLRPDLGSTGGGVFISVIRFCIKLIHLPIFSQACMYLMQQQAVSPYIKMNGAGKINCSR